MAYVQARKYVYKTVPVQLYNYLNYYCGLVRKDDALLSSPTKTLRWYTEFDDTQTSVDGSDVSKQQYYVMT